VLTAGQLLGNRYRLDERIATGGMGDVWRGTDVVLGRVVAVKVLRTAMLSDPEFAARFYGEARMMAAFRHPGVVEVYDYASADDTDDEQVAYLVMAYVEGEPLSNRVKQGPMSVTETMSIVAQAADALHAAHEAGTVHRDVKPGNLIVKPSGAVVLVDFGVARSAAVTSVTQANAIVGTALYMAPEQVAKGNVSPATDIYALGAVAWPGSRRSTATTHCRSRCVTWRTSPTRCPPTYPRRCASSSRGRWPNSRPTGSRVRPSSPRRRWPRPARWTGRSSPAPR
jgi:serine/threonine protein kinase